MSGVLGGLEMARRGWGGGGAEIANSYQALLLGKPAQVWVSALCSGVCLLLWQRHAIIGVVVVPAGRLWSCRNKTCSRG